MKLRSLILMVCLLAGVSAFAQTNKGNSNRPLVQFTGIIYNADSAKVIVPYVTITNLSNSNSVYVGNYKGYFSFVVHENDTLRFTAVGFAPLDMVIPTDLDSRSYTVRLAMKPQVISLPAFHMFPWATTDEFRKDFLTMKLADDDLELARKNLSKGLTTVPSYASMPRDANEIQSDIGRDMHNRVMNSHSLMPNPLLNPLAWGSLIKLITDGGSKSKN